MSYGFKTCPHCHGEMRVYYEGDGSSGGRCPNCERWYNFAPMKFKPRIDPEGAFYEVIIDTTLVEEDGTAYGGKFKSYKTTTIRSMESLGIYTNLEGAIKRIKEVEAEAEAQVTDTSYVDVSATIKRWNHDRTEWEFWRPEYAELDKEVSA